MFKEFIKDIKKELSEDDQIYIKRFINLMLSILMVLLIIIVVPIVIGYVRKIIDGKYIIDIAATVLSGYLGLFGAVIGVIGTYGAFYLGIRKEKAKEILQEKREREQALQALYYMLNNSIQKTVEPVEKIVDMYISVSSYYNFYRPYCSGRKIKKFKNAKAYTDDNFMNQISDDFRWLWEEVNLNLRFYTDNIEKKELENIHWFKETIEEELKSIDFSYLIYDEDWYKHICKLNEVYASELIEWFNMLKYNKVENVYRFLQQRNLMILDLEKFVNDPLLKNKCGMIHSSDIAHNYKYIYKHKMEDEKRKLEEIKKTIKRKEVEVDERQL